MANGVQFLGGHTGNHMRTDHVQRLRRQQASRTHRGKILGPVYRYPPRFGAAIHHNNLSLRSKRPKSVCFMHY